MNLTSELPFWFIRDGLIRSYPSLEGKTRCDALVVGGGISGSLLAHELVRRGVDCVLIDRRDIGLGSTSASTALLQYEIDTPLCELRERVGTESAERAYWLGIDAIHRLKQRAGSECGFALRPSMQLAARRSDVGPLTAEYRARRKVGLPVTWMDRDELRRDGIKAPGALYSTIAAEVDPYRLTHRLLRLARERGLRVFDRTTALRYRNSRGRITVDTDRHAQIVCRGVFFATGYETQEVLQQKVVRLKSTYAFVSEPLPDLSWWKDRAVIWGTGEPYLYMRTTDDRRVLVGGEDDFVLNPQRRDRQLISKTYQLIRRFRSIFPAIRLESAFSWAGVFGSTKDGLAYIGCNPKFPGGYFALGFGGNGITFSQIASGILADLFLGRRNLDERIFRFDR